jgi:hypothetical protein
MFEHLSDLENLIFNQSGKTPFVKHRSGAIRESLMDLEVFSLIEVLNQLANSSKKSSDDTLPKVITQGLSQAFLASRQTSPIVAIAGILNAGKSSMVAGFLSPAGRDRLLIGASNQEGTHRFVLWLPESWRGDKSLWVSTLSQIESIFGYPPEELSMSREIAFEQYNGRYSREYLDRYPSSQSVPAILIPLVATDSWLDSHGIGLMDCPDIQTGFFGEELSSAVTNVAAPHYDLRTDTAQSMFAARRRGALAKSLQISSAFVVVSSANSIQDEVVSDILGVVQHAMPGLRTILAVNRVPRRYTSSEISNEIATGYREQGLWRVYMAYHFEGPLLRERIPPSKSLDIREQNDAPESVFTLPVFFRIDKSPPAQPPAPIAPEDFLASIGEQLDPSQLAKERLGATLISLKTSIHQGLHEIETHNQRSLARRDRWHDLLAQAILRLSTNDKSKGGELDSIRLQVSHELIQQISTSLEKTAPWWARPGRIAIRWSSKVQEAATQATSWLQLPTWITRRTTAVSEFVTSRWRTGDGGRVISSRDFFDAITVQDLSFGLLASQHIEDRKIWEERFQNALKRFQSESRIRLSNEQLDSYTSEMWQRMSWGQSFLTGVAPAGLLFAPIIAAAMLPFEGGTTAMLTITLKEFLGAGLATVGLSMMNKDTMPKLAEEETAWSQMSELFAVCCDELGLERPSLEKMPKLKTANSERTLLQATLPVITKQSIDPVDRFYAIESTTLKSIKQVLTTLG